MAILFACIFSFQVPAESTVRYFWSFGDIGINWDIMDNDLELSASLRVGNFNWITNSGFGWGVSIFEIVENENDPWTNALILPVEVSYSPFANLERNPFLTFYARGGWLIKYNSGSSQSFLERSEFFGAAGLRAAWFPRMGKSWSMYNGAYLEYTTRKELRIGVSVDLTILALAFMYGFAYADRN